MKNEKNPEIMEETTPVSEEMIQPEEQPEVAAEKAAEEAAEQPKEETFQSRIPKDKRTALLRYMAVLFAAAFVLVLLSMLVQMNNSNSTISQLSQSSASALAKAEQLQEDNRALEKEVSAAKKYIGVAREAGEKKQQETAATYDALILLLTTEQTEGDVEYTQALETVEKGRRYLSEEALSMYEALLEELAQE